MYRLMHIYLYIYIVIYIIELTYGHPQTQVTPFEPMPVAPPSPPRLLGAGRIFFLPFSRSPYAPRGTELKWTNITSSGASA